MTPLLSIEHLSVGYDRHEILKDVTVTVNPEERWAIIGSNGTGKSTFIKTIAALLKPLSGRISMHGAPIHQLSAPDRASAIAYVPQRIESPIPYSVYDFVLLGRYNHTGLFGLPSAEDREAVITAMEYCDILSLQDRIMTKLSGGETQRVLLAGALAQEAPLLLLDEPTTFLDPAHERLFFHALERAHRKKELTILMVTHDINTALDSSSHICALYKGGIHFQGPVEEFQSQCPAVLEHIYGISFAQYAGTRNIYGTWGSTL